MGDPDSSSQMNFDRRDSDQMTADSGVTCESIQEVVSVEDGIVQIAFDLTGSPAGYLVISLPEDLAATDEFFGEDHYAEVADQGFGGYGAIDAIAVHDRSRFRVRLKNPVPGIGATLTIVTRSPMPGLIVDQLRRLESRPGGTEGHSPDFRP